MNRLIAGIALATGWAAAQWNRDLHTTEVARFRPLARIDHRFGNEGDFGRPERFSESFAIDPVQVE